MEASVWYLVIGGILGSALISVGGLAVVAALIVRLPPNYFCHSRPRNFWIDRHPVIRWTGLVVKNLLGALAVGLGVILTMPGVPGPGVLMILIGIMLLDFPRKREWERRLVSRPRILGTINQLRTRYGKPPLFLD
jgi:hypothetical protein